MDDPQGKLRTPQAKSRGRWIAGALIVGLCLGFAISQEYYLKTYARGGDAIVPAWATRRQSRETGGTAQPNKELRRILKRIAPKKEVMIAISNANLLKEQTLATWLKAVQRLNFNNWLIVAIDEELRDYCKEHGINHYYRPVKIPKTQAGTGDNHAISSMKFEILEEFLTLGWSVLLSDVDVLVVQNPFDHLKRDSDVEGMSDGFDDLTAYGGTYGVDDPSMGWSRYAEGYRHMAMNSGLFYLRAGPRTLDLMRRIARRVTTEHVWDQTAYNQEMFRLSNGDYVSPQVAVRVMDIDLFMNSKRLFKFVRHLPQDQQKLPVMVHINYHPEKTERLMAAYQYFIEGDKEALSPWADGSGRAQST